MTSHIHPSPVDDRFLGQQADVLSGELILGPPIGSGSSVREPQVEELSTAVTKEEDAVSPIGEGSTYPPSSSSIKEYNPDVHSTSVAGARQSMERLGSARTGQAIIDNNALLNLPPPSPFHLKVKNLWVGVPHKTLPS